MSYLFYTPTGTYQPTFFIGTKENVSEILHGLFVFPDSRLTQRGEASAVCLFCNLDISSTLSQTHNICFLCITDTKFQYQKGARSSEILRVLPALSYAEGKVENTHIQPREDLCGLIVLHMQNYSALVHPGSAEGPSPDIKLVPDIDVNVQKHSYLSPGCTFQAWKSLKSYFKTPVCFQLPVSKATEVVLDDKVEIEEEHDVLPLPSSLEHTEPNHVNLRPVDRKSALHLETTLVSSVEAQSTDTAQSASANSFHQVEAEMETEKTAPSRMIKTVNRSKRTPTPSTSDLHHPTELIVSFTSAERAVAEESGINDELSHVSSDKVKAMDDQTVALKKSSEGNGPKFWTTSQSNELKGPTKGQRRGLRNNDDSSSEKANADSWTNVESVGSRRTMLNKLRNTQARKAQKNTLKKLFKNKEFRYFYACQKEKRSSLGQKGLGTPTNFSHPQKKMERWDLKPVISECGRILVPHGHRGSDQRKALNDKVLSTIAEASAQRKQYEVPIRTNETSELDLKAIIAEEEAAITGTEGTMHKDGDNHSENAVLNQGNLDHNVLRESDDEKDPLTLSSEGSDHCIKENVPFAKTFQENGSLIPDKRVTKSGALLSKLKSVLLRGKRKATTIALENTTATVQGTDSCFKKSKVDSPSHVLENNEVSCVQHPSTREVPMCSVDPHFASVLGLTPKQVRSEMCTSEAVDSQQRNEPLDKESQPDSDKNEVTQNFEQFYPRRGRIKALKKHQSLSTELVKKNCKFLSFLKYFFLKVFVCACYKKHCISSNLKVYS